MSEALKAGNIGPIDVAVVTFEGHVLNRDLAPAMVDLQAQGIVRLIDMAVVRKYANGQTDITEVTDGELAEVYRSIADPRFDLLSKADVSSLAEALPPSSSAFVMVWENTWAARFASAVSASNGHVAAFERIPFEEVREALANLENQ
jgi:hypothetical protein